MDRKRIEDAWERERQRRIEWRREYDRRCGVKHDN